jgi:hypothetical protein
MNGELATSGNRYTVERAMADYLGLAPKQGARYSSRSRPPEGSAMPINDNDIAALCLGIYPEHFPPAAWDHFDPGSDLDGV